MVTMNEHALAKVMSDLDTERSFENVLIAGMFSVMIVIALSQFIQSQSGAQLPVTSLGYPAVSGNAGLVWVQMTPAGQSNQVKIISENSTGAFEEVLLGLTT